MSVNGLFAKIGSLTKTEETVEEGIPCKKDILRVRECNKKDAKCGAVALDLLHCMAQFQVDTTAKIRSALGVARYNEYVKEIEDKHGKDKATEIINEPTEQLKNVEAFQILHRLGNDMHPKGVPKTQSGLHDWTATDQVRLEMGEKVWWDSVRVVMAEFGDEATDRLFGLHQERATVSAAMDRLHPGRADAEKAAMTKLKTVMGPVREAAPNAKTVEEITAAFKKVYPRKRDLDAAL